MKKEREKGRDKVGKNRRANGLVGGRVFFRAGGRLDGRTDRFSPENIASSIKRPHTYQDHFENKLGR